jgi:proteic killer suppression protein
MVLTIDDINVTRYYMMVIDSFKDKETEKIWNETYSKRFPRDIQRAGLRKLILIHRSKDLNDMRVPPGNRLEQLSGNRKGQYSIRINDQYRNCFRWENGSAIDVEITDYH